MRNKIFKNIMVTIFILATVFLLVRLLASPQDQKPKPTFQQFMSQVDDHKVKTVTMKTNDNTLEVTLKKGKTKYKTGYPDNYEPQIINTLDKNKVSYDVKGKGGFSIWSF